MTNLVFTITHYLFFALSWPDFGQASSLFRSLDFVLPKAWAITNMQTLAAYRENKPTTARNTAYQTALIFLLTLLIPQLFLKSFCWALFIPPYKITVPSQIHDLQANLLMLNKL